MNTFRTYRTKQYILFVCTVFSGLSMASSGHASEPLLYSVVKTKLSSQERRALNTVDLGELPTPFSDPLTAPRHYCFSERDSAIFFCADFPGGQGEEDIYVSYWVNEQWQKPVNLGPGVNSPYVESHPFVTPGGKLLFSSNRPEGYGGLDNYYTYKSSDGWVQSVHMDTLINTPEDDFDISSSNDLRSGYFTSKRDSKNTLYSFQRNDDLYPFCKEQKDSEYCYTFSDSWTMPPDSISPEYQWTFNTGEVFTGKEITHCFGKPGQYELLLRVIDPASGDTLNNPVNYPVDIKKLEHPLIALKGKLQTGKQIEFDARQSHLPGIKIIDYLWYFGDGNSAQGALAEHRYNHPGNYRVKLGIAGTDTSNQRVYTCVYRIISISNE